MAFFATSHGKGPCDAIGCILKRMAGNASLAKEHEHPITSAKELYDWSNQKVIKIYQKCHLFGYHMKNMNTE